MTNKDLSKGPKPERVKLNDDWKVSIGQALKKTKPENGWPKPSSKQSKA